MLFAGCKTDAQTSPVFNFAYTQVLVDDIKHLVSTAVLHIDASDSATIKAQDFTGAEAIFIEVYAPESTNDCIELIKKVRLFNQSACIFILVTHSKSFSNINCYVAGADHCLKLPSDAQEKFNLLVRTLKESHWKSPAQLYLDRTRLLLCSATKKLEISYTEMTIINALIQAPEHVLSQDNIAKTLDPNIVFYDPRALEKTISRLRTKIKKTYDLELILSVRAFGYRLRRATVQG